MGMTGEGGEALPGAVAAGLERLMGLFRWLSPPSEFSLTAAATLATLDRSGPCRVTALALREGVTQPAMTQLIARLECDGLVSRDPDPADKRGVQIGITQAGRDVLTRRRAVRAERLAGLLSKLSQEQRVAIAAALPAIDALTNTTQERSL